MSYDPSRPTKRDEIRFLVFDTTEPYLVSDIEIDAGLSAQSDWRLAAANVAENIANQLERKMTNFGKAGGVSLGWGDRAKTLRSQAQRWRSDVASESEVTAGTSMTATRLVRTDLAATAPEYTQPRKRGF